MVAGAEGKRRLDLDADIVGLDASAVVRAVHQETAGAHRPQAGQALGDPVGGGDFLEAERGGRLFAGGDRDQRAQHRLVRVRAEMHRHLPLTAVALEGGADGAVQAFAQESREAPGGRLVADEAGDG